jgi:hypothetical protein
MRNNQRTPWNGEAKRCAICDGRFGLIRYYAWQTPLCSKRCADRFKIRQEADRRWLPRFEAASGVLRKKPECNLQFHDV